MLKSNEEKCTITSPRLLLTFTWLVIYAIFICESLFVEIFQARDKILDQLKLVLS